MKKVCLTIISVLSIVQLSYAQWTTAGNNIYNSNTGNVGIGINSGTAKFAVYQSTALGSVAKNNLLLSSVGGAAKRKETRADQSGIKRSGHNAPGPAGILG